LLDGACNFLHARIAGILAQDPAALEEPVKYSGNTAGKRYVERHGRGHEVISFLGRTLVFAPGPLGGFGWLRAAGIGPAVGIAARGMLRDCAFGPVGYFLRCFNLVARRRQWPARAIRKIPDIAAHRATKP
jgi:hypothetical protein